MFWGLDGSVPENESSSRGSGAGALQSVSEKDVGRPVITASTRSRLHNDHQTRYLISFELSETSLLLFCKLRPRVVACLTAMPLIAQDLCRLRQSHHLALSLGLTY